MSNALKVQVAGTHYQGKIQPVEFLMANPQLDFAEVNMIKYAFRHKGKNGLEDLLKVVHYAMFEAKFHYGKEDEFTEMIRDIIGEPKSEGEKSDLTNEVIIEQFNRGVANEYFVPIANIPSGV